MNDVRWKIDGYQEWLDRQNLPIHSGLAIDLMTAETAFWPRIGADAAFVHLDARGDFCTLQLTDIAPGGSTNEVHHLYEEVIYVLDGRGSTSFETEDGTRRTFEWGRGSLFSLPVNVRYRHFNASGDRRARLACVNNLPMVMKLFRNEQFVFDTPFDFSERITDEKFLRGEGTFIPTREHRHMWETNLVPDLLTFDTRCIGTRARSPSGSTGATGPCTPRRSECGTSTSTSATPRRATSPSGSGACATRS
jgi:quercetin dioxygenase-like cupin family protein